ncbi:palmitoyltransferase ZDHHC6 [Belonocnema kinseyi]|uniref:palmitoyltransferase ZDHHC6 n=1 Tax=Belonocnema kinseyi TaxID=2817044 RepID=UPI00143CD9A7|nr:palmitoyltransferase ZDHHC6 [Belonocnema kinseyi]
MCTGPLRKVFHWGPLTALGLIKIITLMTIHCSRQWLPPQESLLGAINFLFFSSLSGSTLYHFINAIFEGPGYLPLKWMPENLSNCQYLQFCTVCQGYKAPRSHHCRSCGRCVMKMDHHCPWINNCVGHLNHGYFTAFLASAVGGSLVATIVLVSWILAIFSPRPMPFPPPSLLILFSVIFAIGLSIGVVIAVGMLLYFQVVAILKNKTGIEDWILAKAQYRRYGTVEKFVHPYDIGWQGNVRQVIKWHCIPPGDGIHWPVIEGCDQYSLTREQLVQKLEKRKRARKFRVVVPVSGSWIPISHGFRVLCSPPCTNDSRIRLKVGDVVNVTRRHKYWLFGEKEEEGSGDNNGNRIRGWFPRPSAIEVIENGMDQMSHSKVD